MKHRDAPLRAQRPQLIFEFTSLVHRLVDKRLGDGFAEGSELAPAIAAHETLYPGEADAVDFDRLLVEHGHPCTVEDLADLLRAAAFIIVVAEHAEHWKRAGFD